MCEGEEGLCAFMKVTQGRKKVALGLGNVISDQNSRGSKAMTLRQVIAKSVLFYFLSLIKMFKIYLC